MKRVLIDYHGDTIELPFGDTIVGRDLSCQFRLNDPAVSRRHIRFVVGLEDVRVVDLGSRNGTKLNGMRLVGSAPVSHGDAIQVGARTLSVRILGARDGDDDEDEITQQHLHTGPHEGAYDDGSGEDALRTASESVPEDMRPPEVDGHDCPRCRLRVPVTEDICAQCGYEWERSRPHAVTTVMSVPTEAIRATKAAGDRRGAPRLEVDIAVLYTSDSLSFEASAHDLSRTGMFVATELLEPVGTACRITVLLDGTPAVAFSAEVTRVVDQPVGDAPAGLGTRFAAMTPEGDRWLTRVLDRIGSETHEGPKFTP